MLIDNQLADEVQNRVQIAGMNADILPILKLFGMLRRGGNLRRFRRLRGLLRPNHLRLQMRHVHVFSGNDFGKQARKLLHVRRALDIFDNAFD